MIIYVFFRCLARHIIGDTKGLEAVTLGKYSDWLDFKGIKKSNFKGIF